MLTTKDALEKIEKEFDEKWKWSDVENKVGDYTTTTIPCFGELNTESLEKIKSFYRTALSTLLQQVGEEAVKTVYEVYDKKYRHATRDYNQTDQFRDEIVKGLRSRLDSVINPLPSEV